MAPSPPNELSEEQQALPQARRRKSKTWTARMSALLPTLITNSPDFQRKPLPPSPAGHAPPVPYRVHDRPATAETPVGIRQVSAEVPNPSTPDSISTADSKRSTLTKQAPLPKSSSRRSSLAQDVAYLAEAGYLSDNPSPSRLKKENPDQGRRRSGSLQQSDLKGAYPEPRMKAQHPAHVDDARGRSVSAQVPSAARASNSGTRVTSSPVHHVATSSIGSAGQSPTRGRLRRSWMPGKRSRSNSVDPSGKTKSKNKGKTVAWVMSDESNAEYNHAFLINGEKVHGTIPVIVWRC